MLRDIEDEKRSKERKDTRRTEEVLSRVALMRPCRSSRPLFEI